MSKDNLLKRKSIDWMVHADSYKYSYNFTWMGRPIIRYPNDMIVMAEIFWRVKPNLVIETGIAHGGSLAFYAGLQKMMDIDGEVVGIDIDFRNENKIELQKLSVINKITTYEGDSISEDIIQKVESHITGSSKTIVILDSNHSHNHVAQELEAYSKFVSIGSYMVLPDTFIEFFPKGYFSKNRPWDVGNNPYTAAKDFLEKHENFVIDEEFSQKALISEAIEGYLRRIF